MDPSKIPGKLLPNIADNGNIEALVLKDSSINENNNENNPRAGGFSL